MGETIANANDATPTTIQQLKAHYNAIREGIGAHKQPAEYGSFPFDPYSHTPSMAGVQQPGMTGQVKEDIINRFFELGVSVKDGCVTFAPQMLTEQDFQQDGTLRFTYCGVPITYIQHSNAEITIRTAEKDIIITDNTLPYSYSEHLFARDGQVSAIIINLPSL